MKEMKRVAKKHLVSVAIVCSCAMVIAGCDEKEEDSIAMDSGVIELANFSNTGCKPSSQTRSTVGEDNTQEFVIVKAMEGKRLNVEHKNAMFNCGTNNLQGILESAEGNAIKLSYKYDIIKMDCMCPFDTKYIISGLKEGESYSLYITNNYGEEKEILFIYSSQLYEVVKL